MEQHMENMENLDKKPKLGKAGAEKPPAKAAAKPSPAPESKKGLKHFVTLTRGRNPVHFLPKQVTRIRTMVAQDGNQTEVQDRAGRTQVQESLTDVLEALGLNTVKFHRHNINGTPHEVFFVAEQVCRVKAVGNITPQEQTVVTDASGDTTVMEPEDVVLGAIDNALG